MRRVRQSNGHSHEFPSPDHCKAVAERMRKYWASRREDKAQEEGYSTEP